ncbi:hypothetical protein [Streptomyces shenzhenensis]
MPIRQDRADDVAAALGVESEQAAQGRYRRKVGNLNGADSGLDGTP